MVVQRFFRQFSGPAGPLGRVAGRLMARLNGPLNDWVIELLGPGPESCVLEVGYGPGLGVERVAARLCDGRLVGVDHSALMQRQAARRNRAAIAAGRVELRVGTAGALPVEDAAFTHAFAVNSLQFWPDLPAALGELARALVPHGQLVLALRMRDERAGRFDRSRHGISDARLAEVCSAVQAAGFRELKTLRREIRGEQISAVLARA